MTNIPIPKPDSDLPPPTSTARMNVTNVYYCFMHNSCLLSDDTYMDGDVRKCRKHKYAVTDQTNTPLGESYRHIVNPTPRPKE